MGVENVFEQYEFAIYYVVEAGNNRHSLSLLLFCSLYRLNFIFPNFKQKEKAARPLNRCEYIFDVITELTKLNNEFYLIFKRILWYFPLRLDIDGYIDMIYNQILPDYVEGLVVVINSITNNNKHGDSTSNSITNSSCSHINVKY